MKNLFLPFLVVALFAIGSCGDNAVQPNAINPKDTTKKQDTIIPTSLQIYHGEVVVTKLPAISENWESYSMNPGGNRRDTTETVLSYFLGSGFDDQYSSHTKNGDTLTFVREYKSSTSTPIGGGYQSSERKENDTITMVLDTNSKTISYFRFQNMSSSYSYSKSGFSSNSSGNSSQKGLTLHDLNYSQTDSTMHIKIYPDNRQLTEILYSTSQSTSSSGNNDKITDSRSKGTRLLGLRPFTSDFSIEIKLQYHYK